MNPLPPIDPASDTPLHRQVYDGIRTAILSGTLGPGDRLPPSRVLAKRLSLSRTTIAEAYDQLRTEGYLHGRLGSGTFVAPDLPAAGLPMQPATRIDSPVSLAPWGRRALATAAPMRSTEAENYRYDLRPHRVARDAFPWDAWQVSVERALAEDRSRLLSYPPPAGHPELREAIALHVRKYRGVECFADDVVVVNGTQQGINLLAELMLVPGDRVAVEDPGYPAARQSFEARGLAVTPVPVDAEGMVVDALAAEGPHRMVHVTPSHQEPTGATLSLTRRLALLELAEQTGCVLIEDDYDSEFRFEGRPIESLSGLDRAGLSVYAGTFSKSMLPGLRIGFMALPRRLVQPVIAAKSLWDSGAPMLEQAALAQFMTSGEYERHIRRLRRTYRSRRDALVDALTASFGSAAHIGERHGGLNVLVSLDVPRQDREIVEIAARSGIGLRSARPYYAVPPETPTFVIGFGEVPEHEIAHAVSMLAHALGVSCTP